MFGKIGIIFTALKQGESLFHAEAWKNIQLATNAIVAVLTAVLVFVPNLGLSTSDIASLAFGIATIGSVINGYFTVATTKKIGIPSASDTTDGVHDESSTGKDELQVRSSNSSDSFIKKLGGQ